ncbi:hypothetical protein ACFZBU_16550 [Embleya sp. NPDC008237]|uniref:hypothetical protein n=1 Tax=Embleya sp. NPDC008237 TaxID=3363978 RepID=UPI0036E17838
MSAGHMRWDDAGDAGGGDAGPRPALARPRWWPADAELDAWAAPAYTPTDARFAGPSTMTAGAFAQPEGPSPIPLAPGFQAGGPPPTDLPADGSGEAAGRPPWFWSASGLPETGAEPDPAFGGDWAGTTGEPNAYDWKSEQPEPQSRVRLVIAGVLLVTGITVAAVLLTGGGEEDTAADAPPSSAPPATASVIAPDQLAAYQPRQVTRRSADGRIQVSWQAPTRTDGIAGYMAIAQSPAGAYQKTELPGAGETSVVFTGPPVSADSCVVVVTLITGEPSMKLAPGAPVCGPPVTGTPASGMPSSGTPASGTPGAGTRPSASGR